MDNQAVLPSTHPKRVFPVQGTNLAKIIAGSEYRNQFHANLKTWNPVIAFLYRIGLLSLFGVNRTVMLLITRGCKTGKIRYTPIGYFDISGKRYLISAWGKNTGWYRNLTANPEEVWTQIGLKREQVTPVLIQDKGEILSILEALVLESPATARYLFGWDPEVDRFSDADFTPILEHVLFIRFEQCNS